MGSSGPWLVLIIRVKDENEESMRDLEPPNNRARLRHEAGRVAQLAEPLNGQGRAGRTDQNPEISIGPRGNTTKFS